MSRYTQVTRRCAICGKTHQYKELLSTSSFGGMDLDTRPCGMERNTLECQIQFCDNCLYANYNIDEVIDGFKKEFLDGSGYKNLALSKNIDETARAFMLSGYLYAKTGEMRDAAFLYLRAAWIFDDRSEKDFAKRARIKALKYLTEYTENTEDLDSAVVCVDLSRRTGDFQDAFDTANQLIDFGVTPLLESVLKFEKELCLKKDDECHNIEEVK